MYQKLMNFIICPDCKGELMLEVREENNGEIIAGNLNCSKCENKFPIIRGIPRFIKNVKNGEDLKKVYAHSFGYEWTNYNWLRNEDEFEFFKITDLKKENFNGKIVFDAGCGGGRFMRFLAANCREIIGLDYSIAVDKARELCKNLKNVNFIQCDINNHPFKKGVFDIIYSHGVIHHTPNTKKTFDNLPSLVKPGGIFYLAVFRKAFFLLRWSDSSWRSITNKLSIPALDKVCGALSYLYYLPFGAFLKRFFWFSLQSTKEIRKCCLFDWYGPKYHHEHTVEEVIDWFSDAGFKNIKYINAWPYCPAEKKYAMPQFKDNLRLGLLLGVIGQKKQ